jgi:hypothetical protein
MNLTCLAGFWQGQNGPDTVLIRGCVGPGLKNSGDSRVKAFGRYIVRMSKPDRGVTFVRTDSLCDGERACPGLARERLAGARAYVMVSDIRGGTASGPIVYSILARSVYICPLSSSNLTYGNYSTYGTNARPFRAADCRQPARR